MHAGRAARQTVDIDRHQFKAHGLIFSNFEITDPGLTVEGLRLYPSLSRDRGLSRAATKRDQLIAPNEIEWRREDSPPSM